MANVSTDSLKLRVADDSGTPTFTVMGDVLSTPSINPSKPVRDRTSIGDKVRKYAVAGPEDPGQTTIELRVDKDSTEQKQIFTDYEAETAKLFEIVYDPDNADEVLFAFPGKYISYNGLEGGVEADGTMTVTVQLTGKPTKTPADLA